jgi:hypothetical protein
MRSTLLLAVPLLLAACGTTPYIAKGTHEGVEVAYRWNHPPGKPSELLLRLKNTSGQDKRIDLGLDLSYQGRTVETFEADTCLRPGQVLMGKLNGFYFVPKQLTTEQIKDGGTEVDATRTAVTNAPCR